MLENTKEILNLLIDEFISIVLFSVLFGDILLICFLLAKLTCWLINIF
jgi:hypothetical protein